jgi:hypothetical protein
MTTRQASVSRLLAALVLAGGQAFVAGCGAEPEAAPAMPSVGVWYRGQPSGVPQRDDLAVMKAVDFSSVTWPSSSTEHLDDLRQLAKTAGLAVITRDRPVPVTPSSALAPGEYVDVAVTTLPPASIAPLVWRAVAHGARVVSFDAGSASGSGLANLNGEAPPWLAAAKGLSRQISFNTPLIAELRAAPPLIVDAPKPRDLDVVLLETERAWLVVATSTSDAPVTATVHLPAIVPYALWVSMIDGTNMSMLANAAGPIWTLDFPAFGVGVYVIDKKLR